MTRPRLYTLALLLPVIASAWGYLFYRHWQMVAAPMDRMGLTPQNALVWPATDWLVVFSMWAVMMVAMMLPSSLSMVLAFAKVCQQRTPHPQRRVLLFVLAYLSVWFAFSIAITWLQWQFHQLQWLTPMMESQNRSMAGALLCIAGIYQFTPLKNACLSRCRSPLGFLLNEWRDGDDGAFWMGFTHGYFCLGCCWAQMLIMFAVGVMSLPGMVLITSLVVVEKWAVVDAKWLIRVSGTALVAWGLSQLLP